MQHLPISLNIRNKAVLVVGGGDVAARKARHLIRAGGDVTLVAPQPGVLVSEMYEDGQLQLVRKSFGPQHLRGMALAVAATDNAFVNRSVFKLAEGRNIPVNVVDQPELCSFIFPAVVDRSPVSIAISTSGTSPVLARSLKSKIEKLVPPAYGQLAELLAAFRSAVKLRFRTLDERRRFWEETLESPVTELALAGRNDAAKAMLHDRIVDRGRQAGTGEVYLVGAGLGDPDLLTVRAARLLHNAEVVFYDRLVAPAILDNCRRDADLVFVGKSGGHHTVPQEDITRALIEAASRGKKVVRLKGGDPFVFGRGGEEIQALAAQGIPFQVVPGITAASGCGAYSGIPLTHRDFAQSVTFVTGHTRDGRLDIDWNRLTGSGHTVVFYMGLGSAREICTQLMRHGRQGATPAALIENGTSPAQRVTSADLLSLPDKIEKVQAQSPALLIVGEVVSLRETLGWFAGKKSNDNDIDQGVFAHGIGSDVA